MTCAHELRAGQVMRRRHTHSAREASSLLRLRYGHRLEGDWIPLRTPGKKDKPLRYVGFGGPTETKKPGPSLL